MVKLQIAKNLTVDSEELFIGHTAIVGSTGAGKSRNVAAKLLSECLEKQPLAPSGIPYAFLVIDTNDEYVGFIDRYPDRVVVFSPDATRGIPFRISSKNITIDELNTFLKEVTKKEPSKAELATLYLAIDELRAKGEYTLEQLFTRLYELEAYSILPAFEKMMATNIFAPDETPLKLLARPGQASILAIGGHPGEVQAIIVAHLLRALFLARKNGEAGPVCIFIEECSTFAPEGELAPSSEVLRFISMQGRGYHFILINIFQRSSLTSKNILSQISNWAVGKTTNPIDRQAILRNAEKIEAEHDKVIKNLQAGRQFLVTGFIVKEPVVVAIPDQRILLAKGGRVKPTAIEAAFRREDMTNWVARIRSLEDSERRRMKDVLARLRSEREEKAKTPVIPKETQRQIDRLKRDLEQTQARYQRALDSLKEKERDADRKAQERYETRIKELEAEVERLTRQTAIAGAEKEKPVWEQDIVKLRLSKLSGKQRDLVIFLERGGPSVAEKIAPTLGVAPKTVSSYVSQINKAIQGLVAFDDLRGVYYSRLTELFPVGEKAEREFKELQQLRSSINELQARLQASQDTVARLTTEKTELTKQLQDLAEAKREVGDLKEALAEKELKLKAYSDLEKGLLKVLGTEAIKEIARKEIGKVHVSGVGEEAVRRLVQDEIERTGAVDRNTVRAIVQEELGRIKQVESEGGVMKVTGKITEMEVHEKKEVVTADKSTLRGRIALLIAKYNFMQERHNLSQFLEELSNHGWNHSRKEIEAELLWFCDAGLLQRKISTGNVWWYSLVPGMDQRIRLIEE